MKIPAALLILALTAACASVPIPDPCRDPEPFPVPYWEPPANIQPLQPAPILQSPDTPTPTTEAETEAAIEAVTADLLALKADSEMCRHRYEALVDRIMTEVPAD